jgi:hypothetical protein
LWAVGLVRVRYTFVGEGLSFVGELFVGAGFACGARLWVGGVLGCWVVVCGRGGVASCVVWSPLAKSDGTVDVVLT